MHNHSSSPTARSVAVAATVALLAAVLLFSAAGVAPGQTGKDGAPVSLSAEPERLEIRQCLPETLNVGMKNETSEPVYADALIDAEAPIEASREVITSYLPTGYEYVVPVRFSAPRGTQSGEYEVLLQSGISGRKLTGRLSVPVSVAGPPCIPREQMTATATSAQLSPDNGPRNAIDGNEGTIWHTRYSPTRDPLPQSITLDLGDAYDVTELVYQPRTDSSLNGSITSYNVYASSDGQTFTRVASGAWAADTARFRKTATFDAQDARYIRLEATAGIANYASASEIVLFGQPSGGS